MNMPVLIKDIDQGLYARFKARAIERGLKIDEAFTEAVKVWLDMAKDLTPREQTQEKNELAYRLLKGTLEKEYLDKWAAIIDGKLVATADSRELLFVKLREVKRNDDPALVFQVGTTSRHRTLGFKRIHRGDS